MTQPTAQEQYMLELINRARANPSAEAARFNLDLNSGLNPGTISNTAKQPLVFNPLLINAARGHSSWMLSTNLFSHTGAGGSSSQTRMIQAGYSFFGGGSSGENLAWAGSTGPINPTTLIAQEHEDLFRSASHRTNLFRDSYKEIGIGALTGTFQGFNALVTTQNFANSGNGSVFLTGVAFNDAVLNDDFYTVGEGLGNVQVDVISSTGRRFRTFTSSSGGYQLQVEPGATYSIFFSGAPLNYKGSLAQATVFSKNVKVDFEFQTSMATRMIDPMLYGASNADLIPIFGNNVGALLQHYIDYGFAEGRQLSSFDAYHYLCSNRDLIGVLGANVDVAASHYVSYGYREGRLTKSFDTAHYLASNPDLLRVFGYNPHAATWHYASYGYNEGRLIDTFDGIRYLASNSDLIDVFRDNANAAVLHFVTYGANEGRATQSFDAQGYLNRNTDLQPIFGNDLLAATRHYVQYGYREGRV